MNIILDTSLKRINRSIYSIVSFDNIVSGLVEKLPKSNDKTRLFVHSMLGKSPSPDIFEGYQYGYLGMLSYAYSHHEKIAFGPHDLWYIVLTELATVIKNNETVCRQLFTRSETKVNIVVPTDDIASIDISKIVDQLRDLIPIDLNAFIPTLSTYTTNIELAMCAAICDGVQKYYSYMTFMCGIPEIKLTGTETDWLKLERCASDIADLFEFVGLEDVVTYINGVRQIIESIMLTYNDPTSSSNVEFWKSIFTSKNIGSGGELSISGWITKLFYKKHPTNKLEHFTTNLAIVPFKNAETGREFLSVHGCFEQRRTDDGFLHSGYGSVVFEEVPKCEPVADSDPNINNLRISVQKHEIKPSSSILYRNFKIEQIRDINDE